MGYFATILILYGVYLISERTRSGTIFAAVGCSLWAGVALYRNMQLDLFLESTAFACLYIRSYIKWERPVVKKLFDLEALLSNKRSKRRKERTHHANGSLDKDS